MYLLHRKKIDIYAYISLFISYSEVTVSPDDHCSHQIQSVSRSDEHCSQQIQSVSRSDDPVRSRSDPVRIRSDGGSAPRDDLYNSERHQRPGHLDEPQRQISSEDLVT